MSVFKNLTENLSDSDIARGYRLTHVDCQTALQPSRDLVFHEIQEQTLSAEEQVYRVTTNTRNLEKPYACESVSPTDEFLISVPYLEELFEEKLANSGWSGTLGKYVVCEADTEERRQVLGLPNRRPLPSPNDTPAGNTHVTYLSLTESCEGFHKQPMNLQSVRVLWHGSPRLWLVVAPRHSEALEASIVSYGTQRVPQCSQFVTHESVVVPPSTLRKSHISFSLFVQNPGELVWTDYGVYCCYWNMGANIVEETTCCDVNWRFPPLYRACQPDLICGKPRICFTSPATENTGHNFTTVVDITTLDRPTGENMVPLRPTSVKNASRPAKNPHKFDTDHSTSFPESPNSMGSDFAISADRPSQRRLPSRQNFPVIYDIDEMSEESTSELTPEEERRASSLVEIGGHEVEVDSHPCSPAGASTNHSDSQSNTSATQAGLPDTETSHTPAVTISSSPGSWQPMPVDVPSDNKNSALVALDLQNIQVLNRKEIPTSPTRSSSVPKMQTDLNEIDNLIQLGTDYQKHIIWPSNQPPQNVKGMLTRFKPFQGIASWLNDECIHQVLAYLIRDRDDVLILDSLRVSATLASGAGEDLIVPAEGVDIILIPVIQHSHWFLVSLDVGNRSVVVHEDEHVGGYAGQFFLDLARKAYSETSWILRHEDIKHMYPSKNTMPEDCGIRLLGEAIRLLEARRRSMKRPVETLDTVALRKICLGFLLGSVIQENQTVQLLSNLRPSHLSHVPADARPPVIFSINENPNDAQAGDERYLEKLASAVGCSEVLADLKNASGILRVPPAEGVSRVDMAMQMYALGDAAGILSFLQKDIAAFFLANRFSEIVSSIQAGLPEAGRTRLKKRGRGRVESEAYDRLEREWNQPQMAANLRRHIQSVNYHGQKLLDINKISANRHLWMFFPARKMAAPADPTFFVTPFMWVQGPHTLLCLLNL